MSPARAGLVSLLLAASLASPAAAKLLNPGFEEVSGSGPAQWTHTTANRGYEASAQSTNAIEGATCARLTWVGEGDPADFGALVQQVDAKRYRGKRIRFQAALRAEGSASARLWMRVDRPLGQAGFFDNMWERPVKSTTWRMAEIVGDVADDAEEIVVGCMHHGVGSIFIDSASLEIVGNARRLVKAEKPKELSDRGLENLVVFSRLYGFVRYFHPSDKASRADWDRLVVGAVKVVEKAKDPEELARILEEIFRPIAPAVKVFASGARPAVGPEPDATVREWVHLGFDPGGSAVYKSSRIDVSPDKPRYAKPSATPVYELGQGLSCFVPRTLLVDRIGTLPHEDVPSRWQLDDEFIPHGGDRFSRLGAVVVAWNALQHFYPYFDDVDADWPEELRRALRAAATDRDGKVFLSTLRRMVAALRDGHGRVTHPDEVRGLLLPLSLAWVGDQLVVVAAREDLPFSPGDVIEAIDGRPIDELRREKGSLISGATPQWIRQRLLVELIRCEPEQSLLVKARSSSGAPIETFVSPKPPTDPLPMPERPEPVAEIQPGIWYIDTLRFDAAAFEAALPDLSQARGIIVDFRGYPQGLEPHKLFSHLTQETVESPQWLVPLIRKPDRRGLEYVYPDRWKIEPQAPYFPARKAFLIDAGALSFAESCLGIVEGHKLGALVGQPTGGTNGNVTSLKLPGEYNMAWTAMKVLKHDDSPHHGVGVRPTTAVAPTQPGISAGRDEILERAVEIVSR